MLYAKKRIENKLDKDVIETYTQVGTDLFATHGLKHFLQLDTELLNVV